MTTQRITALLLLTLLAYGCASAQWQPVDGGLSAVSGQEGEVRIVTTDGDRVELVDWFIEGDTLVTRSGDATTGSFHLRLGLDEIQSVEWRDPSNGGAAGGMTAAALVSASGWVAVSVSAGKAVAPAMVKEKGLCQHWKRSKRVEQKVKGQCFVCPKC